MSTYKNKIIHLLLDLVNGWRKTKCSFFFFLFFLSQTEKQNVWKLVVILWIAKRLNSLIHKGCDSKHGENRKVAHCIKSFDVIGSVPLNRHYITISNICHIRIKHSNICISIAKICGKSKSIPTYMQIYFFSFYNLYW